MKKHPNIVFIHSDSFDGRSIGCMGHQALEGATPNLDRLAEEGVLFENAYSTYPLCCPARASMWSGRFAHNIDAWNNSRGLDPETPTVGTELGNSGYHTHSIGRSDYLSGAHSLTTRVGSWTREAAIPKPVHGESKPPQVVSGPVRRCHERDWQTVDRSRQWLEDASDDNQPFMLSVGLHTPHHPFSTSQFYYDRIKPERVPMPQEDHLDHPLLPIQRLQKNWGHAVDTDSIHLRRRIYFAMIAEVDEMVGEILGGLDECGLSENTWVFFAGDHGEMAGEHCQYIKLTLFESSIRVPMIVRAPGVSIGRCVSTPVSLVDLYPTFLDTAGVEGSREYDGFSLLPEINGESAHPDWVFAEHHSTCCPASSFMLRTEDWKYIAFPGYPSMLFNLNEDPGELTDLSRKHPEKCADMDKKMREIVDYECIDKRVKEYDREHFSAWRKENIKNGDYQRLMSSVYGGKVVEKNPLKWSEKDEERIVSWLEGNPPPLPEIP